ncbi:IS1595 family transposase [Erythrobacter sp. KY5]|uniref:IS1595 family transposase n=1 Tax=Erythrobacter sp. KY5 TaxID=2011159 RepID=UPI000DBEF43A|nr:IS1595 family transposase [Erythrobacter sp. KY5]AWW74566.1 IS1595 family transposase [Erythrobacter sp. KY5]
MEVKSQHFLLSKQARSLSKKRIQRLTEDEAFAEFCAVRFEENDGEPFCPWCGHKEVYSIPTRRKWRCKSKVCGRDFSATSDTVFASHKLPFRDLLLLVAYQSQAKKNFNAIDMSQELEVQYKTAFVWCHKLREAIATSQHEGTLRGQVEIDGAYFGGYIKPKNSFPLRQDRRRLVREQGKRKCVVIFRERGGRSRALVCSESEAAHKAPEFIEPGSIIYTDDAVEYNRLAARYKLVKVNHSKRYSEGDACTNWAESYFARLRRAEIGIHHHFAGTYLHNYANEISWREDRRRFPANENYEELLRITSHHPVSRQWKGYWQRYKDAA